MCVQWRCSCGRGLISQGQNAGQTLRKPEIKSCFKIVSVLTQLKLAESAKRLCVRKCGCYVRPLSPLTNSQNGLVLPLTWILLLDNRASGLSGWTTNVCIVVKS